jgi:hypothetical protein
MSMTRILPWLALAGLATLVALASPAAAEWYEGKPDCPPDQFCTMSESSGAPPPDPPQDAEANGSEPIAYGPEDCIECSGPVRGPADCENCRGDGAPQEPQQGTCMDGSAPHAICDREVQYLDGGNGQPRVDQQAADKPKAVPAVGGFLAFLLAAMGVAAIAAFRKR